MPKFMNKNSRNCDLAGGREAAYITLSGKVVLGLRTKAGAHGIEWHHAAGHTSGREIISFFPKSAEEEAALDRLAELVAEANSAVQKERAELKAAGLPTSKAAIWRHLEEHGSVDRGYGGIDYKIGKFGPFVPNFGEADGHYFFDSAAIAEIAAKKL